MRSYRINTDKLINCLIPHYLGGRKLILFLQSCMKPLDSLNVSWKEWADEKRMEATMTSQVILLENYLNRKFNKYLKNKSLQIVISDGPINGVPLFMSSDENNKNTLVLYGAGENANAEFPTTPFRYANEERVNSHVSFIISCPEINTNIITKEELTAMINYQIRKYCIAGKKFTIIYE